METKTPIHVKIGEVKVGRSPDILKATLGSCLGVAFMWKEKGLFGLAHCLLPLSTTKETKEKIIGAKFVDQAIDSLQILMKIPTGSLKEIEVVLSGGGNMMAQLATKNSQQIGVLNAESAKKILKDLKMAIKHCEIGGEYGRQFILDCSTGEYEIVTLKNGTAIKSSSRSL